MPMPRGIRPRGQALLNQFEKMDANHDGILTVQEFVAAHPKMGAAKASTIYKELASLGGTIKKGGVTRDGCSRSL